MFAAPGWFTSRCHTQELSGTKQPYEVKSPQKPLRSDEPVKQNDELDPRRVTALRQAGAAGIETGMRCGDGLAANRVGFS